MHLDSALKKQDTDLRIVLVDDHHELRGVIRKFVERQPGMTVVAEGADGREAVSITLIFKPDIVVMDFKMPEMNGIESAQRILAVYPEIDIIMISMFADQRTIKAAYRAGVKVYLLKDCLFDDLIPAIYAIKCHEIYESRCFHKSVTKA